MNNTPTVLTIDDEPPMHVVLLGLVDGHCLKTVPSAPAAHDLTAPAAHFRRPVVRTFVDWALEEARNDSA